jgi:hypothetical protein
MKLQNPGSMKVWRSPVLYFGVLLVVAVIGLLLAPVVVDWNGYRSDLESYGRKLTGRAVTVEGDISVRLFPWPRLTAEKVTIANPPGLTDPHFATAERIPIRMTLAGLVQGGIDVESIEVEQPAVMLERRATGEGTWVFTPSAGLINSDILSRVKLDQVIYERTWVHVGLLHPATKAQRGQKLSMFVVGGKATYEPFDPKDSRIA